MKKRTKYELEIGTVGIIVVIILVLLFVIRVLYRSLGLEDWEAEF